MALFTFLGTGTSQGVPVIGCRCEVCTSTDRRDNRLRTSAMVEISGIRIVIDAGPDFRQQMLREGVAELDAILFTHHHKDHTGGLDDVRAFNFNHYPRIRPMHIYATATTANALRKDYDYAFAEQKYIGAPELRLHEIDAEQSFKVGDVERNVLTEFNSSNTELLNVEQVQQKLLSLSYIRDELAAWQKRNEK